MLGKQLQKDYCSLRQENGALQQCVLTLEMATQQSNLKFTQNHCQYQPLSLPYWVAGEGNGFRRQCSPFDLKGLSPGFTMLFGSTRIQRHCGSIFRPLDAQAILDVNRSRGSLSYQGSRNQVFPDLPSDVLSRP